MGSSFNKHIHDSILSQNTDPKNVLYVQESGASYILESALQNYMEESQVIDPSVALNRICEYYKFHNVTVLKDRNIPGFLNENSSIKTKEIGLRDDIYTVLEVASDIQEAVQDNPDYPKDMTIMSTNIELALKKVMAQIRNRPYNEVAEVDKAIATVKHQIDNVEKERKKVKYAKEKKLEQIFSFTFFYKMGIALVQIISLGAKIKTGNIPAAFATYLDLRYTISASIDQLTYSRILDRTETDLRRTLDNLEMKKVVLQKAEKENKLKGGKK